MVRVREDIFWCNSWLGLLGDLFFRAGSSKEIEGLDREQFFSKVAKLENIIVGGAGPGRRDFIS